MESIMMRIVPYSENNDLEEIETLTIIIKSVPFEGGYAPAFYISSPSEEYLMTIDELSCLMDGIDIARKSVDEIINFILISRPPEGQSEED